MRFLFLKNRFQTSSTSISGEEIETDPYNCYGTICSNGEQLTWDAACMFHTAECSGRQERVLGQCCPVCHNTTTIAPYTTTPPPTPTPLSSGACLVNGNVYQDG